MRQLRPNTAVYINLEKCGKVLTFSTNRINKTRTNNCIVFIRVPLLFFHISHVVVSKCGCGETERNPSDTHAGDKSLPPFFISGFPRQCGIYLVVFSACLSLPQSVVCFSELGDTEKNSSGTHSIEGPVSKPFVALIDFSRPPFAVVSIIRMTPLA